jgi:hypothetical protein
MNTIITPSFHLSCDITVLSDPSGGTDRLQKDRPQRKRTPAGFILAVFKRLQGKSNLGGNQFFMI